jgi:hypothetical protein
MKERLCFVQFIHPGGEHGWDEPGWKHWNLGRDHRRKFMRAQGALLTPGEEPQINELVFWGEWEPESQVVATVGRSPAGYPKFIHEPFLPKSTPIGWRQNTDPFVFGGFHYTGCLQHANNRPTQLRFLERGSVILFGSCLERSRFVLDTLFIVDRHIDHTRSDYRRVLNGEISPVYKSATIEPWYTGQVPQDKSHRLYFGATYELPVEGMFSFFPCLPAREAPKGFPRPEIVLPQVVTPNLYQGKRLNPQPDVEAVRGLWHLVVEQVRNQGLALGVFADTPK